MLHQPKIASNGHYVIMLNTQYIDFIG